MCSCFAITDNLKCVDSNFQLWFIRSVELPNTSLDFTMKLNVEDYHEEQLLNEVYAERSKIVTSQDLTRNRLICLSRISYHLKNYLWFDVYLALLQATWTGDVLLHKTGSCIFKSVKTSKKRFCENVFHLTIEQLRHRA